MNRKGQALVEFVLILPIFIMILFAVVDFGMILSKKSELENISVDVIDALNNNDNVSDISSKYNDIDISTSSDDNTTKIVITKKIDIITPGLNRVLGDPYEIKVERIIYNDENE